MKKLLLITMFAAFLFGGFSMNTTAVAADAEHVVILQDNDQTPDKDKDKDKEGDKKDKKGCCDKKAKANKSGDCDKKTASASKDCDKKSKAPCKSESSPDKE